MRRKRLIRSILLSFFFAGAAWGAPGGEKSSSPEKSSEKKAEKKTDSKAEKKDTGKKKKADKKAEKKEPRKKSGEPRVIINEILYHPVPNDPAREFVELLNPNATAVDLAGWSLAGEVKYTFPSGTSLPPKGYVVIGGDPKVVGAMYNLKGVLGPLKGKLSRKGGDLYLLDSKGDLVEEVTYDNKPPFPLEAAGGGASLERIHPDYKAAWHWRPGAVRQEWVQVEGSGVLSGDRLVLYLSGQGACLIDDVRVVARDDASSIQNLVKNSSFEISGPAPGATVARGAEGDRGLVSGTEGWDFRGNHSGSRKEGEAKEGKACLELAATGPGFGEIHSASTKLSGLPEGTPVKLTFWARAGRGAVRILARLAGEGLSAEAELPLIGGSPGAPNRVQATDLDPWIRSTWNEPKRPLPGQPVFILAKVEDDEAVAGVTLEYSEIEGDSEGQPRTVRAMPMADEGVLDEAERAFHAMLPPFPDGAVVRYRVLAADISGKSAPPEAEKAFYVGKPISRGKEVGSFELLISPSAADSLEKQRAAWVQGMVIFDGAVYDKVRVRHRGHSSLGFPKPHFKLHFGGEKLEGKSTVNLSASWADKSYLRELLAHAMYAEAGVASCEVKRFARIYVNGKYWGLYYQLEQPGRDYLKRNGRDPEGDLFKCYTSGHPSPNGSYSDSDYQNKSSKVPHYELLHEFLSSMDSLSGTELTSYIKKHVDADELAGYLAATALVMNSDHVGKNYYLYRDPKTEKWSMFPWDLDLTFGRNFECGHPSPLLNDKIRWDNHILFGTEGHPKCDVRGNRIIDKFLSLPENRMLLYRKLAKLLPKFTVAHINTLIRPRYLAIRGEVPLDRQRWGAYGPKNTWDLDHQVEEIQNFVASRVKFLAQGLKEAAARP